MTSLSGKDTIMKGSQWLRGLLISVFCLPAWSAPPLKPELLSEQVQADKEGWWKTGFLVGTVSSKGWEVGFIWESGELEVLAGKGTLNGTNYPAKTYEVSVQPEFYYLWDKLRVSRKPLVIRYQYPFWSNPFATNSGYRVIDVQPVESSFSKTPSFTQYPNGIDLNPTIKNSGTYTQRQTFGLVLHVARWLLNHKCTVYLHLGGTARSLKSRPTYKPSLEYNVDKREYEHRTVLTYETYEVEVPNVVKLYTDSEAICRYAEDSAISQSEVYVEYYGVKAQADTATFSILNSIHVAPPFDEEEN
ncbi:hypothetical protein [Endozoicomonas sp. ALB032]|uniref:hypothetical protein n=1 Tax=Endozoicomonas sp. ALB032 TaxID=3403082 RepID=UPI003BB76FCC